MGKFLEDEKARQTALKAQSSIFSDAARGDGVYKDKPRPFCLPLDRADENLFPGIRQSAMAYFASRSIKWHDGQDGKPSNHLCDSQVCGVNFLLPLADKPQALAHVLRRVYPGIREMLPIENGQFVACEWIGAENYLKERISRGGKRTRGANFTSADMAVMFERADGRRQIVLIEWKYTESYGGVSLKTSASGTDRTAIYRHLWDGPRCPVTKDLVPDFDSLFCEPFYQFMRQQFLASEMENAKELGADVVSVLHIAPAHNRDFARVTSPGLAALGESATGVWKKLVRTDGRFISVSTEKLFGALSVEDMPEMRGWLEYVGARYSWLKEKVTA